MIECLSFHARYRCRHSGACCRTGWHLPFSDADRAAVERLGLIQNAFHPAEPGVSVAARREDGACVFLETDSSLCSIHRAAGARALPLTCRMFPRIVRHDPIASRLSLSHYCPTAAAMLFEPGDNGIVAAPPPLVDIGPLDGLDACDELPPLLRPDVLMDLESYRAWETHGVLALTTPGLSPQEAVDRLAEYTRDIAAWTPGEGSLGDRVANVFHDNSHGPTTNPQGPTPNSQGVQRWLAARLFGNWIAYQGRGLETIVRYVQACLDVVTNELGRSGSALEAIRRADYLIVHEADSQELARELEAITSARTARASAWTAGRRSR